MINLLTIAISTGLIFYLVVQAVRLDRSGNWFVRPGKPEEDPTTEKPLHRRRPRYQARPPQQSGTRRA